MRLRVYLAGHALEEEYREIVKKQYGEQFDLIDPVLKAKLEETDPMDIPPIDKALILTCHVLVAYIRKATFGTAMEIIFAYMHGIPVILIDVTNGEIAKDIWVAYHIRGVFYSIRSCFDYLLSHQLEYIEQKIKKESVMEPKVATKLLGKEHSPMIIRKTNKFGFPLFVSLICDADLSNLDEIIMVSISNAIHERFNGEEEKVYENPQNLRNLVGEISERIKKNYEKVKEGCVEGIAVILYADKCFISSLWGDFMNHGMCREELYFALNFMTGV